LVQGPEEKLGFAGRMSGAVAESVMFLLPSFQMGSAPLGERGPPTVI
jgi:hypothetical protein